MEKIRNLKARKGFTIVELIIVIAIIGVLLAMVLPSLLSSNKDTEGKGFAKEFFYKTQDYVSRRKLVDDPDSPALASISANYIILYAQISASGVIEETGIVSYDPSGYSSGDKVTRAAIDSSAAYDSAFCDFIARFQTDVNSYIPDSGYDCTYYAIIDKDFRVHAAYWTDCEWDDIVSGNPGLAFDDDCITGGYYSCAYPVEFCMAGRKMFDV